MTRKAQQTRREVNIIKIDFEGAPEEIAALVLAIQERRVSEVKLHFDGHAAAKEALISLFPEDGNQESCSDSQS